ncbi:MAG: FliH/SctL family protein [Hydrogenovibrio sp.]|uniref:FliH/SctL family protein n=1 Tax=Hydrogenovibrio sp. TaxID=2065821 RepID=UPI00286FF1AE|nr:FliH/SctL family protein [Hydrogenovibrio sp.]MDR9499581.1 FliH/SctL family protein [Hydrogenovibrio sp.]
MNKQGVDVTPESPRDENLPVATVLPAEEVSEPDVKAWHFTDFEKEEVEQARTHKVEVTQQLRREIEPRIKKETQLLKKEAYESAKKEGYEAGLEQGRQEGRQQAFDQAKQEADAALTPKVESLGALLDTMASPYQAISEQVFESLSELAIALASRLVELEVDQHQAWLKEAIEEAVAQLPDEDAAIEVHLNPEDYNALTDYLNASARNWTLKSAARIKPGTCEVKQHNSIVVNDWQTRLETLLGDTRTLAAQLAGHDKAADATSQVEPEPTPQSPSQSESPQGKDTPSS